MIIQHNLSALNSYRQLGGNNSALSKNLEKLSSGYRINRAGDDAAGLAISEKMRAQIKGLETAQKNSQDGISLVQTAEGALTEVHSMLNRMAELATQSANGTFDDETDRANLQKEVTSLKNEIDRISKATNFNGINLLDGSLGTGAKISMSGPGFDKAGAAKAKFVMTAALTNGVADEVQKVKVKVLENGKEKELEYSFISTGNGAADAGLFAKQLQKDSRFDGYKITAAADGKLTIEGKENGVGDLHITFIDGKKVTVTHGGDNNGDSFTATSAPTDGETYVVDGKVFTIKAQTDKSKNEYSAADFADEVRKMGYTIMQQDGQLRATGAIVDDDVIVRSAGGLQLQIGDTSDAFNQIRVKTGNMSTKGLGIEGVDISSQIGASEAVKQIKDAINKVSSVRGDLGAVQNRLEHTINNLGVTAENMTAAESRIRDTDMAKEMMAYTKNNILIQASQAMLAQANQVPQGVLQLLQ